MQFGVALPNFGKFADKQFMVELSRAAEALGYDSLWASDHVVIPHSHEGFGDTFYDPLITLSYIAAHTSKITLGTSVMILPYRNPIVLAKCLATLDVLSGGRLILGVGAGWLRDEFDALGVAYEQRGPMTDEYIEIIKKLWSEDAPVHKGDYYQFREIGFFPKPLQDRGPRIWVGGGSNAAIRRAAQYGDGWHPVGTDPESLERELRKLDDYLREYNRDKGQFVISLRRNLEIADSKNLPPGDTLRGTPEKILKGLRQYRDLGVSHIVLHILSGSREGIIKTMERFSQDLRGRI